MYRSRRYATARELPHPHPSEIRRVVNGRQGLVDHTAGARSSRLQYGRLATGPWRAHRSIPAVVVDASLHCSEALPPRLGRGIPPRPCTARAPPPPPPPAYGAAAGMYSPACGSRLAHPVHFLCVRKPQPRRWDHDDSTPRPCGCRSGGDVAVGALLQSHSVNTVARASVSRRV